MKSHRRLNSLHQPDNTETRPPQGWVTPSVCVCVIVSLSCTSKPGIHVVLNCGCVFCLSACVSLFFWGNTIEWIEQREKPEQGDGWFSSVATKEMAIQAALTEENKIHLPAPVEENETKCSVTQRVPFICLSEKVSIIQDNLMN